MAWTLLLLPLEIRQLIYEALFSTYTIRRGFSRTSPSSRLEDHKDFQKHNALFLTCSQLYLESRTFLPLRATFHFRGTESMLDTFLSMEQSMLTRVRHIIVKAFTFPLYPTGRADFYSTYYFSEALKLLPGLNLDVLEVEDAFHGFGLVDGWRDVVTYFDIESLLNSDAWKELIYTTPNTDFIASGYDHKRKRLAQPSNWDLLLKGRDGEDSGAAVRMFITLEKGDKCGVTSEWSAIPGHEAVENWRLAGPEQALKGEVKIVAKRGLRKPVVQTGIKGSETWRELKGRDGGFHAPDDWTPYYNDMGDAMGWIYGGWGRRMQMASMALNA